MINVSVIIPTYNRADKLMRAVNSVLQQTYTDYELIIVDDCSTDSTRELVDEINDKRVKYVCMEQNSGAAAARNKGVQHANGRYIAFHDSDDEWLPEKLAKQIAYMNEHADLGMVYGQMYIITADSENLFPEGVPLSELEGDIFSHLLLRNSIGAPTMFIKKDCFIQVGGFDASLRCLEDWEFAIRFAKKYRIGYIDEPLIIVYSQPGGVSYNIGGYYEARCKMIAMHKEEMQCRGIFDKVVLDMFERATKTGVLKQVQAMLMIALQGTN